MISINSVNGLVMVPRPSMADRYRVDIRATDTMVIKRRQGETLSIEFLITDGFSPANLVGWSNFTLTVNSTSRPLTTSLYVLSGSVDTSGTDGLLSFPITAEQAQIDGRLSYDMEATTPNGQIVTLSEGVYMVLRDK